MSKKILRTLISFSLLMASMQASSQTIDTLIGYIQDRQGLVFQVYTGGCTAKSDFQIAAVPDKNDVMQITLYRTNPDYCRGLFPFGEFIRYGYIELGLKRRQSFQVLNPINPGFLF